MLRLTHAARPVASHVGRHGDGSFARLLCIAVVWLVLVRPRSAAAGECWAQVDVLRHDTTICEPSVSTYDPGPTGPYVTPNPKPNISRDTGAEYGITGYRIYKDNVPAPVLPPPPVMVANPAPAAESQIDAWWRLKNYQAGARGGRAPWDDLIDVQFRGHIVNMRLVPRRQGGAPSINDVGLHQSADARGDLSDPIDPVTGELVVEHVDLAFPGFGVRFEHQRRYSSRVDYVGPLGPGWDHSYNQRLLEELPPPADASAEPPTVGPSGLRATLAITPGSLSDEPRACGPVIVLTTGAGTSVRFRELGADGAAIAYSSPVAGLRMTRLDGPSGPRWEVREHGGDLRAFDQRGLLVAQVDRNGIGLAFTWEPAIQGDWRLAFVEDSVGRHIQYHYDELDRLTRVDESTSDLYASYDYDAHGDLRMARRFDGRTEYYDYDLDESRQIGDWLPEGPLQGVCTDACALSSRSCDAGGACDAVVQELTADCLGSCSVCNDECVAACGTTCGSACRAPCRAATDNFCLTQPVFDRQLEWCNDLYEANDMEDKCATCADECRDTLQPVCESIVRCAFLSYASDQQQLPLSLHLCGGGEWPGFREAINDVVSAISAATALLEDALRCAFLAVWDGDFDRCNLNEFQHQIDLMCDNDVTRCCAYGDECTAASCHHGVTCAESCRSAFFGYPTGSDCLSPVLLEGSCADLMPHAAEGFGHRYPDRSEPQYQQALDCGGSVDAWVLANGCLGEQRRTCNETANSACLANCQNDCEPACASVCSEECHVADCAGYCDTLDLAGECEDSCTTACVTDGRARGPFVGPKYGSEADLNHNLVRIHDGAGVLYLENVYGTDIASPDFDTVIAQRYGAHQVAMSHADLTTHVGLPQLWGTGLVEELDDYDAPAICHYGCTAAPPDRRDFAVPWGGVLFTFTTDAAAEDAPRGGFAILGTNLGTAWMPPLFIPVVPDGVGGHRPAAMPPPPTSEPAAISLTLQLPGGAIGLLRSEDGSVQAYGAPAALALLHDAGGVTLIGDGTTLRAYLGAPLGVAAVGGGQCTRPFDVRRVAGDVVAFDPADACSGSLWMTPLASRVLDTSLKAAFQQQGQPAITTSYFRPLALVPVRQTTILEPIGDGQWARRAAPGTTGSEVASLSVGLYWSVPLLRAPPLAGPDVETGPLYVHHHVAPLTSPEYPPPSPPSDRHAPENDMPEEAWEPPCDPTTPVPTLWGTGTDGPGEKPARATVITDLHGARWTYYADARGEVLRTHNHETGASWWFEHDLQGRVVGVLAPDGARQWRKRDARGDVIEEVFLPAERAGMPQPAPIRRRCGWGGPGLLAWESDPRDPTRVFRTYERDATGNLRAIVEADGLRTALTPLGGTSPARALPSRIEGPDGAVVLLAYDEEAGVLNESTIDPTGAALVTHIDVDAAGRPTTSVSPLGFAEQFDWVGPFLEGRTWIADGLTASESYAYDVDGRVESAIRGVARTELAYDDISGLRSVTRKALDGSLPNEVRCQRLAPGGRLLEIVDAMGTRMRFEHDGEGHVSRIDAGDLGASPEAWDDLCPAAAVDAPAGGTLARFAYDTSGRLIQHIDGRGLATTWTYDGFGRAIEVNRPDGGQTRRGYDAMGNVTWEAGYSGGGALPYRRPEWGDPGLLSASETTYDRRGHLETVTTWHFDAQGQPIGDGYSTTTYTYDEIGRSVSITDDAGHVTTVRADAAGRLASTTGADGTTLSYRYEDGGRTIITSRPGPAGVIEDVTTLNALGAVAARSVRQGGTIGELATATWLDPLHQASTTDVSGTTTAFSYDAFDRLRQVTRATPDGVAEITSAVYDGAGRVRTRTSTGPDLAPATWLFDYDALSRLVRSVDPSGAETTTIYIGPTSLPQSTTDPRGVVSTMQWASGGWLATVHADLPGTLDDVELTYHRDAAGALRLAQRRDGGGIPDVTRFEWDSLGNKTKEWNEALGVALGSEHVHDGLGQRVSSTIGGHTVARVFDPAGRLASLRVDGAAFTTARWSPLPGGFLGSRTLGNGVTTTYAYDRLGRLAGITDQAPNWSPLSSLSWATPLDGVPRRSTATRWGGAPEVAAYELDASLRLTAEQRGLGVAADFALDPFGASAGASTIAAAAMTGEQTDYTLDGRNNWTARAVGASSTTFGRDARDALVAIGGVGTVIDARGALVQEGPRTYTYDALGLLARVEEPGGTGVAYERDGLGRITAVRDLATSELVRVGWDGAQQVVRRHLDGSVEATVAAEALDDLIVTLLPNGGRRYYHQDRQGSVYLTTAASGAVDQWLSYDAYGGAAALDTAGGAIPDSEITSSFGYHGLPHDFSRGLVDMRARSYRTDLGQCLSPDPIGLAGGSSLFAFVDSAPLAFRDPSGLAKEYRNALGDSMLLAHGDAFLFIKDVKSLNPHLPWSGPAYFQWKAQAKGSGWSKLDPSSFARATQDALEWENNPEKGQKFDKINQSLQPITRIPELVCAGTCANISLAGDLGAAAGELWYGTGEPSINLGDEDIAAQMASGAPPIRPGRPGSEGVQRRVFSVGPYRPAAAPLENHHGVLDVWARHNIPGYRERGAAAPTISLTKAQHDATQTVYRQWSFERAGRHIGARIDWSQVSAREVQTLTNRMFDAAGVPEAARREYYRALHQYIYGLP